MLKDILYNLSTTFKLTNEFHGSIPGLTMPQTLNENADNEIDMEIDKPVTVRQTDVMAYRNEIINLADDT